MSDDLDKLLESGHWYRVNGRVYYCVRYAQTRMGERFVVHMEGIRPQDYAAYVTHHFIGENKPPYRTIGDLMDIPMPKPITASFFSDEKVEEISARDALATLLDTNTKAGEG